MMRLCLVASVLAVSLGHPAVGGGNPQRLPAPPARFDKPAMVKFHMRWQFDDLRNVERLLIAGKLEDAKTRAFLLTRPAPDPGMARWQREVGAVTEAARALVAAPSIDEACRREARVAAACARCHRGTQELRVFAAPAMAPPGDATPAGRMARHQWAADRLWEGLVGPSDHRWRAGLDVLVNTPLRFSPFTDAPRAASQLEAFAQQAIASLATDSPEDRARRYGEMLVVCSACHSALHVGSAAPH
jgi:cytochrome c553